MAGLLRRAVDRRGADVRITIDGDPVHAQEGDLLITAVLLHRTSLRRFEFGSGARAGYCWMAACQDCWVQLADGRRVRACTTPVEPGMAVLIDTVAVAATPRG
jgi:NADH dehydrogenase/NADH:ubiquinone oxidoreductase subunit G